MSFPDTFAIAALNHIKAESYMSLFNLF